MPRVLGISIHDMKSPRNDRAGGVTVRYGRSALIAEMDLRIIRIRIALPFFDQITQAQKVASPFRVEIKKVVLGCSLVFMNQLDPNLIGILFEGKFQRAVLPRSRSGNTV